MRMTPRCPRLALILSAFALLFTATAFTQDKPDRPPWAQKSKSGANNGSAPSTAPTGEPGKIVQPTPPSTPDDSQDPSKQRGRIQVTVNLVNVLVSVLDEHNRPAPDLPRDAFQLFEE